MHTQGFSQTSQILRIYVDKAATWTVKNTSFMLETAKAITALAAPSPEPRLWTIARSATEQAGIDLPKLLLAAGYIE